MTTFDRRTFLLGSATLFTVAACSAPETEESAGEGAGSIALLTGLIPETLNPVAGFANTGKGLINEGLLTLQGPSDQLPDLVPNLADGEPEISEDARVWTVRIKSDVTFSDGSPLTAQDVVATFRAVADPASAAPIAGDLVNLASVEATDDSTVVFTLTDSQVSFRTALLIGIAPAAAIEAGQLVTDSSLNQAPIGTGPYVVDSYSTDRLVLRANEDYRDGAPQLAEISYVLAADDNTRAQRMTADFDGTILPPRLADTFSDNDDFDIITATSADWRGLTLPYDNPVTTDPAVRLALNIGIDRAAILSGVLVGFGREAHCFIPPQYGDYYNPDAVFEFDREAAGVLLDEAGWVVGSDGIRAKDGLRAAFTLMYRPTDQLRRDLSAAFASEALELGFDITIEGVEFDQAEGRIATDAILLGGGDTPYDVDTLIYKSLHSAYPDAGAYYDNASRYANPQMDALLDRGRTSLEGPERVSAYQDAQQLYLEEPSMVLLVFLDHTYVQPRAITEQWQVTPTLLEPHEHGTAWGPWVDLAKWTRV